MASLLYQTIEQISRDKHIEPEVIVAAIEDAMIVAARKFYKTEEDLRAKFNPDSGQIDVFDELFLARIYDLDADTPACEAIRGGLPVLLGSLDEVRTRYPALLAEIVEAGLASRASLPLHSATGTTLGAIGFGWARPQEFSAVQLRRQMAR